MTTLEGQLLRLARDRLAADLAARQRAAGPAGVIPRPETDEELKAAVYEVTGLRVPDVAVCPDHVAPFAALADAYFGRSEMAVWWSSRGFGGKSLLLAILAVMKAVTLGASVTLLGGSGEQSKRVHDYMTGAATNLPATFWGCPTAPRWLLASDPTRRETRLTNGGRISVLTASQTSVRGAHPNVLLLDEADEIDLKLAEAALGQPMMSHGIRPHVVVSSTRQYMGGTMDTLLERAAQNGQPIHTWCFRETMVSPYGWLTQAEVDQKRRLVSVAMWDTEYEHKNPSPEQMAFQAEGLNRLFQRDLGEYQGRANEGMLTFAAYDPSGTYVTAADWAKLRNWTIIVTLRVDVEPVRLVAFTRTGRQPWPLMVKAFDDQVLSYPGEAIHDGTGLGTVVDDYRTVDATGITFKGLYRTGVLNTYTGAVEAGDVLAPLVQYMQAEHKFCKRSDLWGAGHAPDSVVAMALAWSLVNKGWSRP